MTDAWRAACRLRDEFGAKAGIIAALRSDELGQRGDRSGRLAWLQVLAALDELDRAGAPDDVPH